MQDNIALVLPDSKELVSAYEAHPASKPIKAAQPFTVSLISAVIAEDLDGILRGKNDALVMSKSTRGTGTKVERIHYFDEGVPTNKILKNFYANNVHVADDYDTSHRLWLEINVVEIDTDTGERKAAVQAFQNMASTLGAVFPALLPHAFGAQAIAGLVNKLVDIVSKDEHVVKVPLSLYGREPLPGMAQLQEGTFVAFSMPQDLGKFRLNADGSVTRTNGRPADVSYAAFNISGVKTVSPDWVVNQRMASLLTQLRSGNGNDARSTLDFLGETLTQYSNFRKLQRYIDLNDKKPAERTDEEKALLDEIGNVDALKPFLPK